MIDEVFSVYFSLGSNLGEKYKNIENAISLINDRVGKVSKISSMFENKAWGFESDNDFVNACVMCETKYEPKEVLHITQQIERELGRTSKTTYSGYKDRIIDIDILLYGDLNVDLPDLQIPHPLMTEREFVMKPLNEIL